jgi:hypothetical protein
VTASADDYPTPKGTGWLVAFADDRMVSADRLMAAEAGQLPHRAPAATDDRARN